MAGPACARGPPVDKEAEGQTLPALRCLVHLACFKKLATMLASKSCGPAWLSALGLGLMIQSPLPPFKGDSNDLPKDCPCPSADAVLWTQTSCQHPHHTAPQRRLPERVSRVHGAHSPGLLTMDLFHDIRNSPRKICSPSSWATQLHTSTLHLLCFHLT